MPARGEHEVEVALKIIFRVVTAERAERVEDHAGELEVERVFAGAQELVIVNAALPPVLRLLVQDVAAFIERRVFRAPKDAVGVRISRCKIIPHHSVVAMERGAIIIPMHRHGMSITNEGAPDEAGPLIP